MVWAPPLNAVKPIMVRQAHHERLNLTALLLLFPAISEIFFNFEIALKLILSSGYESSLSNTPAKCPSIIPSFINAGHSISHKQLSRP
jgi:hypothetical protein